MGKSVDIENKKMRKDVNVLPHRTAQPIGTLAYWHIGTLLIGTLLLFICLSFPLSSFAQSGEIEKTVAVADSLQTKKRPNGFIRAFNYLFNPNDIDTTYIGPNRYNYALMLDHFTNYEYYAIGSNTPESQRLRFSPNPRNKIGPYFGWRWIFLGWSIDTDGLYGKQKGKRKGTEFDLSLYSAKLGVDIFYRRTGNDYKIHKVTGFDDIASDYSESFDGLKVDMKGLNLFYVFNYRRFSYPAAFSQSTNQRRSAGSMIAGFSISTHDLNLDYTRLPQAIQGSMNEDMKVEHIKYTNISLTFGYAYNWVFARNWLACLSLTPAVAYKTSRIEKIESQTNDWYKNFNIDFILRAGVVYNNSKYFAGTSFVGRSYDYYRDNFSMNNGFGTLQVYAGFNFYLKKQYKKKK